MRLLDACVIEERDYSRNRLWCLLVLSLDADSDSARAMDVLERDYSRDYLWMLIVTA